MTQPVSVVVRTGHVHVSAVNCRDRGKRKMSRLTFTSAASGKGERSTTRDGAESPELLPLTVPTAYKSLSGARARSGTLAELVAPPVSAGGQAVNAWSAPACQPVETT